MVGPSPQHPAKGKQGWLHVYILPGCCINRHRLHTKEHVRSFKTEWRFALRLPSRRVDMGEAVQLHTMEWGLRRHGREQLNCVSCITEPSSVVTVEFNQAKQVDNIMGREWMSFGLDGVCMKLANIITGTPKD